MKHKLNQTLRSAQTLIHLYTFNLVLDIYLYDLQTCFEKSIVKEADCKTITGTRLIFSKNRRLSMYIKRVYF